MESLPQIPAGSLGVAPSSSTTLDDTILKSEVYYQYSHPKNIPTPSSDTGTLSSITDTVLSATNSPSASSDGTITDTFVRSEYAGAFGVSISRSFKIRLEHPFILEIVLLRVWNLLIQVQKPWKYRISWCPSFYIFIRNTTQYRLETNGVSVSRNFEFLNSSDYDAHFVLSDIAPWQKLVLSYELTALPASYGQMLVWDLEKWESWADIYGDVGFQGSNTCWANMILWRSGPSSRSYVKWSRFFSDPMLPESIAARLVDANKNGIPDSIENMSIADRQKLYNQNQSQTSSNTQSSSVVKVTTDQNNRSIDIWFDPKTEQEISTMAENLASWLSCWFGWGGCMSFPMNWAPLAPGSAPVVFWYPLWNLTPSTGLPIFSWLTGIPIYWPWWCFPIPSIYPVSPIGLSSTCSSNTPNAGWILGTSDPTNFIRIFLTPTLTLWYWTAICFWPAQVSWNLPPKGTWPLVPGGNCIVITWSLPMCKDDGSSADGDVTGFSWLWSTTDSWNAKSCEMNANTLTPAQSSNLIDDIVSYLKDPKTRDLTQIYKNISARGPRTLVGWPLLRVGWVSSGVQTLVLR